MLNCVIIGKVAIDIAALAQIVHLVIRFPLDPKPDISRGLDASRKRSLVHLLPGS